MGVVGWIATGVVGFVALTLAGGYAYEAISEAVDARRHSVPGQMVDVGEGRRLHVLCTGDAPGPTVVLVMGAMEPSPFWWDIQSEVAGFARVCSYDRPGFGWSPPTAAAQTLEDRAADLHAALAAAGVPGPYVMVGHSYGGALTRLYARDQLDRTAGFVFVDAPAEEAVFRPSYFAFVRKNMLPITSALEVASRFGVLRAAAALNPDATMIPEQLSPEARRALSATQGPHLYAAARAEFASIEEAAGRLGEGGLGGSLGDRPVSVITHGVAFPPPYDVLEEGWAEAQAHLAGLSTDSELIVATKSSHMIHIDEPELVVDAIRRVHAAARDGTRLSSIETAALVE